MLTTRLFFFMLSAGATTVAQGQDPAGVVDQLRASLEQQFRETTGLGFKEFSCDLDPGKSPPRELICRAVDQEDDEFFYRLTADAESGETKASMSQPVSQLNAAGFTILDQPCMAFLQAFDRRSWGEAHEVLSDGFKASFSEQEIKAALATIRDIFGTIGSFRPGTYAVPEPGVHQVEYELRTEAGEGVARFRLRVTEAKQARIVAFLVTAKPKSELQKQLLRDLAGDVLTTLLGAKVQSIVGPLGDLKVIGDAVEAEAVLADGSAIAIWAAQSGSSYDLDKNDYRFQVLDLPTLVRRYLSSTGVTPRSVDCPSRKAPDGGRVDCVATLEDGSKRPISMARRGGEHRVVRPQ